MQRTAITADLIEEYTRVFDGVAGGEFREWIGCDAGGLNFIACILEQRFRFGNHIKPLLQQRFPCLPCVIQLGRRQSYKCCDGADSHNTRRTKCPRNVQFGSIFYVCLSDSDFFYFYFLPKNEVSDFMPLILALASVLCPAESLDFYYSC
jgi:hypothetical protein